MQVASGLRGVPRLPFFRLLRPRLTRAPPMLPLPTSTRIPTIRLTAPNSTSSRLRYSSLAQDSPPPSPDGSNAEDDTKLPITTRLKVLLKSYGWYALVVYLALGVVDFSIAFAAINLLGAEQVGRATTYVKGAVTDVIHGAGFGMSNEDSPDGAINGRESTGAGVGNEGLYAMLVLAYTVHKTLFMPFRAGMTMAITPKFVRWLRTKGFTGQGGATRAAGQLRQSIRRKGDRTD